MKKIFLFVLVLSSLCVKGQSDNLSDISIITKHLTSITKTESFRNHENTETLNQVADYIYSVFNQYADTTYFQEYMVDGSMYKNVICKFNSKSKKPLVILGAHYDVCGDQEGADDNASGVTGILEIARLLKNQKLNYPIEIVAYTLEEPPYFNTENMGSYVHAKSLYDNKIPVYGMVTLEMIGYYSDENYSQAYPLKPMKKVYGKQGDYILLAKKTNAKGFVKQFCKGFKNASTVETHGLTIPSKMQMIDFSDHMNYWKFGFDALLVTNTAFYRNKNYHQPTDKLETLDLNRMKKVIDATFNSLINL